MRLGDWAIRFPFVTVVVCVVVSTAAGEQPQIIHTSPEYGEGGVDPMITEVIVEFDQDMRVGSHSWVKRGPSFPQVTGQPQWPTPRRCILPVKLEPGMTYQLSINGPGYSGFQNVQGEAVAPTPLLFRTAGGDDDASLTPEQNRAAIATLRSLIDERYSYRDRVVKDWDALFQEHEQQLLSANSAFEFAARLGTMLAAADDLHIGVTIADTWFPAASRFVEPNINVPVTAKMLKTYKQESNSVLSGRFEDGIGYLLIATWEAGRAAEIEPAFAALHSMRDAPAIIIDVRPNSGGDESIADRFAAHFIQRPCIYAAHQWRDPQAEGGWSSVVSRVIEPAPDIEPFTQPVAVLCGRTNMSSCEAFLLMMKQAPNVKLIGERSYGSSGNPQPHELGNGVTVLLPGWKALRPDGTPFEGEGIAPDVVVAAEPRAFQNDDPVLRAALEMLREKAPH